MTPTVILGAITALGTISALLLYVIKTVVEKTTKSTAEKKGDIDRKIAEERKEAENTGRPV